MAWLVSQDKLDEQQREFIDNVDINSKNVWIQGFPGSGKSVLLAYTIKKIKRNSPSASILVVVYTHSLIAMFKAAFREMGVSVNVVTMYDFMSSSSTYDYILCDEVQDMTSSILNAMNRKGRHVIVAGDENQSIYSEDVRYHETTVSPSQITNLLSANTFSLLIIHRLSRNIIDIVQRFLPNTNIFSARRDMTKQATQVRLCEGSREAEYVLREAKKAVNVGQTAAILIPSAKLIIDFANEILMAENKQKWETVLNQYHKPDFGKLNSYLANNGIKLKYVGNGYGELSETDGKIALMTYHSSKGLDFDNVFIPYLNRSLFIDRNSTLAKTLFMVAMTRSRNNLYLTFNGYPHEYLSNFKDQCNKIDINQALSSSSNPFGNHSNSPFGNTSNNPFGNTVRPR